MRTGSFFIFFSIILIVYTSLNYYIFRRGYQAIPENSQLRMYYTLLFILISASYLIGRITVNLWHNPISEFLMFIGSFWLAAFVYFLIIVLFLDLLRIINHFIPFYPEFIKNNYSLYKKYIFMFSCAIVILLMAYGHINAVNYHIKKLDIKINKYVKDLKELNIVLISDVHLGVIIGKERFRKIVDDINLLHPDLILIAGDLVDESIGPVINDNIGQCIERLNSKYGIYAITGNHEFISNAEAVIRYFSGHGVKFLRDTAINIENKFILVGREDRIKERITGNPRKKLNEIINSENNLPVILLDHQPLQLDEALENRIDLQLSGHTHHGQIFPFNFIAKKVYELSWGYLRKGDTHFYVSSGVGSWGPPVRIGNNPEIVNLNLLFN